MKYLAKDDSLCIECGACEEACSKAYFKEENAVKSRIRINQRSEEIINVCNQCGQCIDVCDTYALKRNKQGVVMLNRKSCVNCYMCVGYCPTHSMRQHDDNAEPFKCIACGICTNVCPTGAIYIAERDDSLAEEITDLEYLLTK